MRHMNYTYQKTEGGIADALSLAQHFVGDDKVVVILGDNFVEGSIKKAVDETVLGRVADPRDVARVVAFLASEPARHVTGEVIKVDGGQYI